MEEGNKQKKSPVVTIVIIVIIVIGGGIGIYFATKGTDTNTTTNTNITNTTTNTTANTNTATVADPYADLMKYDNKIIEITSTDGKVQGQIGIKIDKTEEYPIIVVYFMKVKGSLPKSVAAATGSGEAYYYIANHAAAADVQKGTGTGALSAAFCNVDAMPDVLAMAQSRTVLLDIYQGCDAQYDPWHTTNVFYHAYATYYDSDTFDYDRVLSKDTLAIFDSAPFYKEKPEIGGYGVDNATVISQGEISAQYDLTYTE